MTLREWMRTFFVLDAPFTQLTVYEAVTGKKLACQEMGCELYFRPGVLDRKVSTWTVTKRPYRFIVAVEPETMEVSNGI